MCILDNPAEVNCALQLLTIYLKKAFADRSMVFMKDIECRAGAVLLPLIEVVKQLSVEIDGVYIVPDVS